VYRKKTGHKITTQEEHPIHHEITTKNTTYRS